MLYWNMLADSRLDVVSSQAETVLRDGTLSLDSVDSQAETVLSDGSMSGWLRPMGGEYVFPIKENQTIF